MACGKKNAFLSELGNSRFSAKGNPIQNYNFRVRGNAFARLFSYLAEISCQDLLKLRRQKSQKVQRKLFSFAKSMTKLASKMSEPSQ
jgi:hypothetical protein